MRKMAHDHQHHCGCEQLLSSLDRSHNHSLHKTTSNEPPTNIIESFGVYQKDDVKGESQKQVLRRLKIAALSCFVFLLVELVGGVWAGSLAILSDAAHRASDVFAYLIFIMGSYIASLPPSKKYTFGFKRAESLVALCSMLALVVLSVSLTVEAVQRIIQCIRAPDEVDAIDSRMMVLLASIGVVINVILLLVLKDNHVHLPGAAHSHDHSHEHGHCNVHSHEDGEEISTYIIISYSARYCHSSSAPTQLFIPFFNQQTV